MTGPQRTALEAYRAALERELAALGDAGLRRRLRLPRGIDLVSNDYLGLAEHPYLTERMKAALDEVGAGSGGSRLGHRAVFSDVEARLAALCDVEATLLSGSGYAANVGLRQDLLSADDLALRREEPCDPHRRNPALGRPQGHLSAPGPGGRRQRGPQPSHGRHFTHTIPRRLKNKNV